VLDVLARWLVSLSLAAAAANAARVTTQPPVLQLTRADEPGERLALEVAIVDRAARPVALARAHVYQTDATGRYTRERAMDEPHARLAGRVTSDGAGRFDLDTVRPGGYPRALRLGDRDRHIPAHIHFDVTAPGHAERKFQVVFADDSLLVDPYWINWVRELGAPVVSLTRDGARWRGRATLVLP